MNPSKMVEVTQEDANKYCEVLQALGMEEEGDPAQEILMRREKEVKALGQVETLKQHLRSVLEVARTWMPSYASTMDRDTLRYANDFLEGEGK